MHTKEILGTKSVLALNWREKKKYKKFLKLKKDIESSTRINYKTEQEVCDMFHTIAEPFLKKCGISKKPEDFKISPIFTLENQLKLHANCIPHYLTRDSVPMMIYPSAEFETKGDIITELTLSANTTNIGPVLDMVVMSCLKNADGMLWPKVEKEWLTLKIASAEKTKSIIFLIEHLYSCSSNHLKRLTNLKKTAELKKDFCLYNLYRDQLWSIMALCYKTTLQMG